MDFVILQYRRDRLIAELTVHDESPRRIMQSNSCSQMDGNMDRLPMHSLGIAYEIINCLHFIGV